MRQTRGFSGSAMRLIAPPFARGVTALEHDHDPLALRAHGALLDRQLGLQAPQLLIELLALHRCHGREASAACNGGRAAPVAPLG